MSQRLERWSKDEIRYVIFFLKSVGTSPEDTYRQVVEVCGQYDVPDEKVTNILTPNEYTELVIANSAEPSDNAFDVPSPEDDTGIAEFLGLYSGSSFNYPAETAKFRKCFGINSKDWNSEILSAQGGRNSRKNKELLSDLQFSFEKSSDLHQEKKDEVLYKKVHDIIEKFSNQNCLVSPSQIQQLDITTEESLNGVIDIVFEKAIDKPSFSIPHANMCKVLSHLKVPCRSQEGEFVDIKKYLLTKCQEEFENRVNEQNREETIRLMEECETDEKWNQLLEEFKENGQKTKRRQLGNARFMGWLFKLNMFTEFMMHQCIKKLLHQDDEIAVKCVCLLLTEIGIQLENDAKTDPTVMESYFSDLKKIVAEKQISAEVRLMFDDVTDLRMNNWVPCENKNNSKTEDQALNEDQSETLRQKKFLEVVNVNNIGQKRQCNLLHPERKKLFDREFLSNLQFHPLSMKKPPDMPDLDVIKKKNNWVPRRDEHNPKTIDQIHKEAEKESHGQRQMLQQMTYPKRMPGDRDWRKNRPPMSEDGWNTSGKSSKGNYSSVDLMKLKLSKVVVTTPTKTQGQQPQPQQHLIPAAATVITRLDSPVTTSVQDYELQESENEKIQQNDISVISDQLQDGPALSGGETEAKDAKDSLVEQAPKKKIALKYCYKENQWSPRNPEGKKQYDREFLLILQSQPMSMKKPSNLPNLEVIKDKATLHKLNEVNNRMTFTAPYAQRIGYTDPFEPSFTKSAPGRPMHPGGIKRGSQQRGSENKMPTRKVVIPLVKEPVILHTAEKAWAPTRNKDDSEDNDVRTQYQRPNLPTPHQFSMPSTPTMYLPGSNWSSYNQPTVFFGQVSHMTSTCPQIPTQMPVPVGPKKPPSYQGIPVIDPVTGRDVRQDITNEPPPRITKDNQQKLEFTTKQPKLKKQITPEEMKLNLQWLLCDHESNEEIFNWLEKHIEGEMSPPMYRALVTVIYESVIIGSGANCELNASKLKERMCILTRYMDVNRNLELHAIFALQHLMNKLNHPRGLLLQIFDLAYNEDLLLDDAFKQWKRCDDPAEQEGKGAAIHSVSSFFTWLKEGDDDESADGD